MIIDKELQFSDAQAVTTATATASENVIDLGAASRNPEVDLWLVIDVDTTVTATGGAANVTFALISDSAVGFDSGSATTHWTSAAIPKATLVAGYNVVKMRLPKGLKRYLKVQYTPDTNNLTAGKFNAMLVETADANDL